MSVAERRRAEPESPGFAPVRMDDVELGAALPDLTPGGPGPQSSFASSLCLVRLHGKPLGLVQVDLPEDGLSADQLAARIRSELSVEVDRHLGGDDLPHGEVTAGGVASPEPPPCAAARDELLRDAPSISVVICTRNRPDSVRTTLVSILSCRYPTERLEVIVVDNASEADAAVGIAAAELDGDVAVRVVREPEPGLSNARNRGLDEASGEIVVFADDDVEVDRDWLATLVGPFARGARVGATSGMTLPGALETPAQRWVEGFGARARDFETPRL